MSRKVFLSFLGTNDYLNCNYYDEVTDKKVENVRFIQDALVQLYCSNFTNHDKILIFLTENAKKENWIDGPSGKEKRFEEGLDTKLKKLSLKADIESVNIQEGYSQDEIWNIFNIVFNKLEDNDEIILDVTHGFRTLPMLGMVLLNYSKFLKNIKVKSIHYGAFEKLGPKFKVEKMELEDRNAPILNLTAFDELQQWSVGADNFVNYGNAEKIVKLINDETSLRLKTTKGKDEDAKILNGFKIKLTESLELFSTIRGKEIIDAQKIIELKNYLDNIKENNYGFKALNPIIEKIEKILEPFKEDSLDNLLLTIELYIKNNQIQQAITLIQEMIITIILKKNNLPYNDVIPREILSSIIHIKALKIDQANWNSKLINNIYISEKLLNSKTVETFYNDYESLRGYRNDINHGGFISQNYIDSKKFKPKLEEVWNSVKSKLISNQILENRNE